MINLTPDQITLIAESGETTTIPASGYVARVETTRQQVTLHYFISPVASHATGFVPVYEETPTEIIILRHEERIDDRSVRSPRWIVNVGNDLLLTTREVAEAAHVLRHPLAERMAWPEKVDLDHGATPKFRSLRRVPRGKT